MLITLNTETGYNWFDWNYADLDYLWPDYLFREIWHHVPFSGLGNQDHISIDLNEKEGYITSYPKQWNTAKTPMCTVALLHVITH